MHSEVYNIKRISHKQTNKQTMKKNKTKKQAVISKMTEGVISFFCILFQTYFFPKSRKKISNIFFFKS